MSSPPPKSVTDCLSPGDSKDLDLQEAIKRSLHATPAESPRDDDIQAALSASLSEQPIKQEQKDDIMQVRRASEAKEL